jgi:hypothetical protein
MKTSTIIKIIAALLLLLVVIRVYGQETDGNQLVNAELGVIQGREVTVILWTKPGTAIAAADLSATVYEEDGITPRNLIAVYPRPVAINSTRREFTFTFPVGTVLGQYDVFLIKIRWRLTPNDPASWVYSAEKLLFNVRNPLPVTMGAFSAVKDQKGVLLKWATVTEINASHFEVEKSTDGIFWLPLGTIKAKGPSTYTWRAKTETERMYYRIKSIDQDGSKGHSKIVVIEPIRLTRHTIFINGQPVNFDLTGEGELPVSVRLWDITGKTIGEYGTHIVNPYEGIFAPDSAKFLGITLITSSKRAYTKKVIFQP